MHTNQWGMNFSESGNTLYCAFVGRLDGSVCTEIEQGLLRQVVEFRKNRENTRLAFDLSEVIYISSAFLRLCLIQLKTFGKDGFTVTNVSEEIHKIFHISGFIDIMHITRRTNMSELAS